MSPIPSRRRLLCREIPCGLAALAEVFRPQTADDGAEDAAFAAFDAEWRAMGPELLAQAARAAGLAVADTSNRDALITALWQYTRRHADVG